MQCGRACAVRAIMLSAWDTLRAACLGGLMGAVMLGLYIWSMLNVGKRRRVTWDKRVVETRQRAYQYRSGGR
jgi:hypothetical protein